MPVSPHLVIDMVLLLLLQQSKEEVNHMHTKEEALVVRPKSHTKMQEAHEYVSQPVSALVMLRFTHITKAPLMTLLYAVPRHTERRARLATILQHMLIRTR